MQFLLMHYQACGHLFFKSVAIQALICTERTFPGKRTYLTYPDSPLDIIPENETGLSPPGTRGELPAVPPYLP